MANRRKKREQKRAAKKAARRQGRGTKEDRSSVGSLPGTFYRKLFDHIRDDRDKLRVHREYRYSFLKQFVGANYSDAGASDREPVNMIELAVNIHLRHLAANSPRVMASTQYAPLKPYAYTLELAVNRLLEEIQLAKTLRKWVLNGMFGLAPLKVGLTRRGDIEVDGVLHDPGQPFADVVDLDDWVHDTKARDWEEIRYCGNRYRLPYEWVRESRMYDLSARRDLQPMVESSTDDIGVERIESLTFEQTLRGDSFEQFVELWDLWIPSRNVVVTLSAEYPSSKPLREVEWDGPEHGPYHHLAYAEVPQSVMPLPPVAQWMDLHELINMVYTKLGRQAENQKDVVPYNGAQVGDAERIRDTADGGMVRVDSGADKIKPVRWGGIDQQNLAFSIHLKDMFSYLAGNLDSLGGLSPQAETLGQERLLGRAASLRTANMQDRVMEATTAVIQDLAWYLWTDPLIELPLTKRMPGQGTEIPVTFTPEGREGDFLQYAFELAPYSMQHRGPSDRLQLVGQVFDKFINPNAVQMQQQGISVNFVELIKFVAKLSNEPELGNLLTMPGDVLPQELGAPDVGGRAANTTRTNVRVNRPGATAPGKDNALIQTMMGGRIQPSEAAGITRQAG